MKTSFLFCIEQGFWVILVCLIICPKLILSNTLYCALSEILCVYCALSVTKYCVESFVELLHTLITYLVFCNRYFRMSAMPCACQAAVTTATSLHTLLQEGVGFDCIFQGSDGTQIGLHSVLLLAKSFFFNYLTMVLVSRKKKFTCDELTCYTT